jgi:hypothetical protein
MMALAKFFKLLGVGNDVAEKFAELGQMFFDLQRGQQHPVLKKQNFRNRSPDRSDVWVVRARAVNGLDWLICSGIKSIQQAAARAVKEAPNLDRVLENNSEKGKADLVASLISWRKALKSGRVCGFSPVAHCCYDENRKSLLLEADRLSPAELRQRGLKRLQNADHAALNLVFGAAEQNGE